MGRQKKVHNGYFVCLDIRKGVIGKLFTFYFKGQDKKEAEKDARRRLKKTEYWKSMKEKRSVKIELFSIIKA